METIRTNRIKPVNAFEESNLELLDLIINQFQLDVEGDHGIKHWRRVFEIGNYLTKETKADIKIVNLFAYLHDSRREDESDDLEHGKRASVFVRELYDRKLLSISKEQLDKLLFACEHHNNPNIKSEDITIQTCWDADMLDLWRIGVMPDKHFLNTDFAKQEKVINLWR